MRVNPAVLFQKHNISATSLVIWLTELERLYCH